MKGKEREKIKKEEEKDKEVMEKDFKVLNKISGLSRRLKLG